VDPRRLLARLAGGDVANVSFSDMTRLVEAFGFELQRTNLRLIERYALSMEERR
jgi:hypothetical protein